MGEGAAAAAGPIGIAVATAIAVKVAVDQAVKEAIGEVGMVISSVASPSSDPAKPIAELGEAASKTGEKLPVLGTAAIVAGESLKALASVMQALDKTAERYGQYSPQIAQAQAIAEVRQTIGDIGNAVPLLQLVGYDTPHSRGVYETVGVARRQIDVDASRWRLQLAATLFF